MPNASQPKPKSEELVTILITAAIGVEYTDEEKERLKERERITKRQFNPQGLYKTIYPEFDDDNRPITKVKVSKPVAQKLSEAGKARVIFDD